MFKYFPPERYAKKCPEIYPTIKGERYIPKRGDRFWQPCFSEPKLVDAAVESALRYFKANPDHEYIAFSVEDGHQFCECERCRAEWAKNVERTKARETQPRRIKMIANALTHSPLYWRFMNRAAERLERELPAVGITAQKLVVGIVYSGVRENPGFGLHPMVLTWFVFKWSDGLIDRRLLPQPDGRYQLGRMQEWLDISSHIGHHDWAHGKGFLIPRLYTELTSESFKLFKPHDLVYTHTEGYPNWGLDGPKLYVHSKIWWNPDVDLARIWRQFCDDMFGPAADPMRDYFDTLHDLWIVLNSDQERKLNRWHNQFDTTPKQREQIAHCRSLLERASQFAETDEQRQRIELFSKTFGLSERFFAMAAKRKATPVEVNQLLDYARKHITPDPMTVYRMRTPEDAMDRISTAVWRLAGSRGLRKPE